MLNPFQITEREFSNELRDAMAVECYTKLVNRKTSMFSIPQIVGRILIEDRQDTNICFGSHVHTQFASIIVHGKSLQQSLEQMNIMGEQKKHPSNILI